MSLTDLPSDIIMDVIVPFLPPRFILDYQLAPLWYKIHMCNHGCGDDFNSTIRIHEIIFSERYGKNKSSLIGLLLKIINRFGREVYGNIDQLVPAQFLSFVKRLRMPGMKISDIRDEITFSEMQFVFEFVSRYNFIYLNSNFKSVMGKSSEPFEFSWVYATDHTYQTHHSLLLRRLKSCNLSQFAYTELEESLKGCKRIRGQFFFRNGQYCCEFYNGLFLNLQKEEEIKLNSIWASIIAESFSYDQIPLQDEYFLQRYFLPSLETKLVFECKHLPIEFKSLGYYPFHIKTKSFKFTMKPSQRDSK